MRKWLLGMTFGLLAGMAIGFPLGVYTLPILVDRSVDRQETQPAQVYSESDRTGEFDPDSPGSDALHWGEGSVRISSGNLVFEEDVRFAPGPDYRIYMTRRFIDNKDGFIRIKADSVEVARLKTFSGPLSFELPPDLNTDEYDNVVVWCETFRMYIASASLD